MTQSQACPACGEPAVPPSGNPKAKILVVGEFPGDEEMSAGMPFVGRAGGVFKSELYRLGLDLKDFRVMNLHLHPPKEMDGLRGKAAEPIKLQNEKCLQAGRSLVLDEAKRKKSILLVGSEAVSAFTEFQVSKVCGLEVPSIFSCQHVWAMVNPAIAFHGGIGEVRMALEKWSTFLKQEKLV